MLPHNREKKQLYVSSLLCNFQQKFNKTIEKIFVGPSIISDHRRKWLIFLNFCNLLDFWENYKKKLLLGQIETCVVCIFWHQNELYSGNGYGVKKIWHFLIFFWRKHRGQPGSTDIQKYYFLYFSIKYNLLHINLHRWTYASNFSKNRAKWVILVCNETKLESNPIARSVVSRKKRNMQRLSQVT